VTDRLKNDPAMMPSTRGRSAGPQQAAYSTEFFPLAKTGILPQRHRPGTTFESSFSDRIARYGETPPS